MKNWIMELCPDIQEWQAEIIAEHAQKLVEAERAECAKVCEVESSVIVTNASEHYQEGRSMGAIVCYNLIRNRSNYDS